MRVDWYVGYPVEAVVTPHKPSDEKWKFGLVLEGGTVIRFYGDIPVPKEKCVAGNGKFLMAVSNYADGHIEVVIGAPDPVDPRNAPTELDHLSVEQGQYSVINSADPEVEWFPVTVEQTVELPPDPSVERAVEGPEDASVSSQDGSGEGVQLRAGKDAP